MFGHKSISHICVVLSSAILRPFHPCSCFSSVSQRRVNYSSSSRLEANHVGRAGYTCLSDSSLQRPRDRAGSAHCTDHRHSTQLPSQLTDAHEWMQHQQPQCWKSNVLVISCFDYFHCFPILKEGRWSYQMLWFATVNGPGCELSYIYDWRQMKKYLTPHSCRIPVNNPDQQVNAWNVVVIPLLVWCRVWKVLLGSADYVPLLLHTHSSLEKLPVKCLH